MGDRRYRAFISYSHRDRKIAEWLHGQLENYRLPSGLAIEEHQRRLRPIFKDREELPASDNLGEAIETALANSEAMIVLCSPSAAISPWIAEEIDVFKRRHGDRNVLLAVVDGEPPYNMPPPLLVHYEGGAPTDEKAEPVAADLRPEGDGRKLGVQKLVAGLVGVELDVLVDRETRQRHRRLAITTGFSLLGMIVAIGLAVFAIQQRNTARVERAEAGDLIEYMLTDLREQLEPVGRLDVLDSVGGRAMEYYARQKLDDLTPDELGRRARAVQMVAEMHNLRGDNERALPAFQQAARTTGELLARDSDNPQRLFDHGQSLFWVGYIAWQRGQMDRAKSAMGDYADISKRLAAMDRSNLDWQMEESYSLSNLGTLANDEGRYRDGLGLFERSVEIVERVAQQEGRPSSRLIELGQGLSWVATNKNALGDFEGSTQARAREIALYDEVLATETENFEAMRFAAFALRGMGNLLILTGDRAKAREALDRSLQMAGQLLRADPDHTLTMEMTMPAYAKRAELNWSEGRAQDASRDFDAAERLLADLRARDPKNKDWNTALPASLELSRALTDRAKQSPARLHALAQKWGEALDPEDTGEASLLAMAHIVDALAYEREGDRAAAARSYARAIALEPNSDRIDVNADAIRALAAERLGQQALASELRAELRMLGVDPLVDDLIRRGPMS